MRPVTLNSGFSRPDFDALLASRQFVFAEAFTLVLLDASKKFYTNAQQAFTVPEIANPPALATYVANEVLVEGLRFKIQAGGPDAQNPTSASIETDEQTITLTPSDTALIGTAPMLQAIGAGALDGAVIRRDRWFAPAWGQAMVGGTPMFYGLVSAVTRLTRTQAQMKVKGGTVLLNIQMPRNLYQPSCIFTVYDAGCGLSKAAHATGGAVGASPSRTVIPWASSTADFALGTITFESGPNIGEQRTIRTADGSALTLAYPLPVTPAPGDLFSAYVGCNRTIARCTALGNEARFRAYPFIPQAETAI